MYYIPGKKIPLTILVIFSASAYAGPETPTDNSWIKTIIQKLDVADYYYALDYDGNLCITGYFMNTTYFDSVKLVSIGNFDVFVAKYSNKSELLWVKQVGGSDPDFVKVIKIDSDNNIFITGYFTGISFFENYIAYARGSKDVYTAKYGSDGELLWVKSQGAEIICEPNPVKRKLLVQKLKNSR